MTGDNSALRWLQSSLPLMLTSQPRIHTMHPTCLAEGGKDRQTSRLPPSVACATRFEVARRLAGSSPADVARGFRGLQGRYANEPVQNSPASRHQGQGN